MFLKKQISKSMLRTIVTIALLISLSPNCIAKAEDNSGLTISTTPEVTLVDLRDMGLILFQIKQQAINIYMEATRKPVKFSAKPKIEDLKHIKKADINEKGKYLNTRPEWLTFYVGTMEPLIHLFKVNVQKDGHDIDYILVPKGTEEKFKSMLVDYNNGVKKMDAAVTQIFENISEKDNNIKVAKAAVNLYKAADNLEKTRRKAFKLIKKSKAEKPYVKVNAGKSD